MHRLDQIIELQRSVTRRKKEQFIGKTVDVLPETTSKKSLNEWMGKTDSNHVVIFPKKDSVVGEIVKIRITECLGATLRGQLAVTKTSLQTI